MSGELKLKLNALIAQAQKENVSSSFDIYERHLNAKTALANGEHFTMGKRMVLLNKKQPYYIIGDLHSDEATLKIFLQEINFYQRVKKGESFQIVFLGDYVDRGAKHLETLECLIDLKLNHPEYICLLRGNHDGGILLEDGDIKLPYRIPEDDDPLAYFLKYLAHLITKNDTYDQEHLVLFLKWFDTLPYIAFIGDESYAIKCVHGGIIKPSLEGDEHYDDIVCLADLTRTEDRCDELFWSDPYGGLGDRYLERKRFKFTEANYLAYKEKIGIDALIRGHEVAPDGVKMHFDGTLYTLFSSGASKDSHYKSVKPRYMLIDENYNIKTYAIHKEN